MANLKTVLEKLKTELEKKEKIRETAQNSMRKATSLSKEAILLIHQSKKKQAQQLLAKAKNLINELNTTGKEHPEIIYSGLYDAACQEYAEANIFLKLTEENSFLSPKEIGVPPEDYVLGLADVIGEYRRVALDALRKGDAKKAEKCLKTMDEIYVELLALDEAYMLVSGLRRKCDVARKIIEITRGDVTQEIRRNSLEKSLKNFEKTLRKRERASYSSTGRP